jgi:two-component system OmpR family response regulator
LPKSLQAEPYLSGNDSSPRVLIVDDDPQVGRDLTRVLSGPPLHPHDTRFRVTAETDPARVVLGLDKDDVDIFIVDLKFKEQDIDNKQVGEAIVRKIAEVSSAGIIVYSSEPIDQTIESLFEGADDYIAKGTSSAIIRSRVAALWRRIKITRPAYSSSYAHSQRAFQIGIWKFEVASRDLTESTGKTIRLTPLEHAVLSHVLTIDDHQIDRDHFSAYILGREAHDADRRLDNMVSRLRKKLGDSIQFVSNRNGGYRLIGTKEIA